MPKTDFNWTEPFNLLLLVLAVGLLVLQCGLLYARHRHTSRFGLRLGLNVLLWLSLLGWIVDPYIVRQRQATVGLLTGRHVPADVTRGVKDSIGNATVLSAGEIREAGVDTLLMVGQEFDNNLFAAIRQTSPVPYLQWIPYIERDRMRDLHWKGILRKGELQRIEGEVGSSAKQMLQVRYGDQVLDSIEVNAGLHRFRLTFPAFSEGRTTTTLQLNGRVTDTLRYYTLPEDRLTVKFLLESPDFETRNLATWLGKSGHSVLYDATLSRSIESRLNINRGKEPDLIIANAVNAGNAAVKKLIAEGKSVLFMGLVDPPAELRGINQALGTDFEVKKISKEESVPLSSVLNALPYRFEVRKFQLKSSHYPVLVEKTTGKIAVSLLNETFPLQLSGHSVTYGKVWNEILAWARPASGPVVAWDAPVFENLPVTLQWNNFKDFPTTLRIGDDTIATAVSALNDRSATVHFVPRASGWLPVHDLLHAEVYVEGKSSLMPLAQMQGFIRSSNRSRANAATGQARPQRLPSWGWFVGLMVCLTALWIEPKL